MGFVVPYAMRMIGVSAREMLNEILLPAFLPAIPMAVILYVSHQMLEPSPLLSIMAVAGIGVPVYLVGYLSARVCKAERETCRSIAMSTIRLAGVYLKSMWHDPRLSRGDLLSRQTSHAARRRNDPEAGVLHRKGKEPTK